MTFSVGTGPCGVCPWASSTRLDLRRLLSFTRQRPPARLAQPPPHRRGRVDVHDQQRLLEAGCPGEHLALVVEHHGMAVEDQLVLPADRVHERDEARRVPGALLEHLLALAVLADVERRRRDVDQQLRAGKREVGRRRAGLPHVLADRHADERLAEAEQDEVAAGREVALLVEDAVVRQEALAVDRPHLAVGADGAGVVQVAVEGREADERRDPGRRGRDLVERPPGRAHEGRAQQQVLRRVARDRELGEEDELGACRARLLEPRQDQRPVSL